MINYRVHAHTFTKLHDRRIPKVRVGVGPMEFKLKHATDKSPPTSLPARGKLRTGRVVEKSVSVSVPWNLSSLRRVCLIYYKSLNHKLKSTQQEITDSHGETFLTRSI